MPKPASATPIKKLIRFLSNNNNIKNSILVTNSIFRTLVFYNSFLALFVLYAANYFFLPQSDRPEAFNPE